MSAAVPAKGTWFRINRNMYWSWAAGFSGIGVWREDESSIDGSPLLDSVARGDWIEIVGRSKKVGKTQVLAKVWSPGRRRFRGYARVWVPLVSYHFTAESPLEALARAAT